MGQAWESCMSLCTRSIDQNSVTCPHLIVREAEKVSELRKKGNRFEKPIAMPATGFCRCHRAMLFNVIVTSHIQDSDSCKGEGRASGTRLGQGLSNRVAPGLLIQRQKTVSKRARLGVLVKDQVRDSCKLVKLRISFESQGKFFCRVWLYVPVLL